MPSGSLVFTEPEVTVTAALYSAVPSFLRREHALKAVPLGVAAGVAQLTVHVVVQLSFVTQQNVGHLKAADGTKTHTKADITRSYTNKNKHTHLHTHAHKYAHTHIFI